MVKLSNQFLDFLFPKNCEHCGDSFQEGLSNVLCRGCFDYIIPYEDPICDHCGVSLPARSFEDALKTRCRDCGEGDYYLDRVRAYGAYGGPLRIAHHAFKFEGMEGLAGEIAAKMYSVAPDFFLQGVECMVPVPMSPERERERGYNPSLLLADELSRKTQIPLKLLLKKTRPTQPQMSLTREERLKNPRGVYQTSGGQQTPAKIILVDDVFTTGSTLEECAKVLKKAGAAWVAALVFGRTPRI
jgi:competence protein ComFC